jgi:hypothetical protein
MNYYPWIICLFTALILLNYVQGNRKEFYACGICGTKNGEHLKDCPWAK